jgi:hypothetical protein
MTLVAAQLCTSANRGLAKKAGIHVNGTIIQGMTRVKFSVHIFKPPIIEKILSSSYP